MSAVSHQRLLREIPERMAGLLGVPLSELEVILEPEGSGGRPDALVTWGRRPFVIELKARGDTASTALAARQAKAHAEARGRKVIPLVAVPHMGDAGRRLCEEAGVSWLDLSGNAHLVAPGLRVQIEGKPNRFKRAGRPGSLFAPKSARIARWLLMRSGEWFTQRQLARVSGLDEGFTSRIVRGLEAERLIRRDTNGAVRVADFDALLHALREAYDFSKHHIVRGHVAARSSDEVLARLTGVFQHERIEYAATGLAGAWLWSHFAGFRLTVLFVAEIPERPILAGAGFHEMDRGENVWLVQPNDAGVFHGSETRDGISCAHPVQLYLDLKEHPERASEAAEELRQKFLTPSTNVQ